MKDLYIIGAGGFGREVAWLVGRINEKELTWNIVGFIDADEDMHEKYIDGYRVLGDDKFFEGVDGEVWVACAVASTKIRKKLIKKLEKFLNIHFAILIDPSVIIAKSTSVGVGTIICAGSVISIDCIIGRNVIIDWKCTVGHDVTIEDFVTCYPSVNISGGVNVSESSELGTGAQVIQGIHIGPETIVGAGAVVVRDIEGNITVVGCPAKEIKT